MIHENDKNISLLDCSPGIQCSSLNAALGNVIAMIDTVTKFDNPKGNGQGACSLLINGARKLTAGVENSS